MNNIVYGTHDANAARLKDIVGSSFGLLNEGYTRFAISVGRGMYSGSCFKDILGSVFGLIDCVTKISVIGASMCGRFFRYK